MSIAKYRNKNRCGDTSFTSKLQVSGFMCTVRLLSILNINPDTDFGWDFFKEGEGYFQFAKHFLNLRWIVYKMVHIPLSSSIPLMSMRTQKQKSSFFVRVLVHSPYQYIGYVTLKLEKENMKWNHFPTAIFVTVS